MLAFILVIYVLSFPLFVSLTPLFLTPLIETGKIDEARNSAAVKSFYGSVQSYSGYLTVSKTHSSNLFFWFFPQSSEKWTNAPLVLWLQGGPGTSSMYAVFTENGPYVFKKGKLQLRAYSWTRYYNMLYIDNPVGTGYSFTDSPYGYAIDQNDVAENLHEALRQFLVLFPELDTNKLILSGESYAGKFILALANIILEKKVIISNIYGLFIGNPIISVEDMLPHYSEYFYWHGLLDKRGAERMRKRELEILSSIKSAKWLEAAELFQNMFSKYHANRTTLFMELTGLRNRFHLLKDRIDSDATDYAKFLDSPTTKEVLHASTDRFSLDSWTVYQHLKEDIPKSTKVTFGKVLEHFRTLIYTGQHDIIFPYYVQQSVFQKLAWNGAWAFHNATRKPFRWHQYLAGYYKSAGNLTDALIRNAGHIAVTDKPQWVLGMLRTFVNEDFDLHKSTVDIGF